MTCNFHIKAFLHPESDERMSEVVLTEIIEDMDVDRDGEVNLLEYITDIINDEDEDSVKDSERDNFNNNLDLDKNGTLDRDEVCISQTRRKPFSRPPHPAE